MSESIPPPPAAPITFDLPGDPEEQKRRSLEALAAARRTLGRAPTPREAQSVMEAALHLGAGRLSEPFTRVQVCARTRGAMVGGCLCREGGFGFENPTCTSILPMTGYTVRSHLQH